MLRCLLLLLAALGAAPSLSMNLIPTGFHWCKAALAPKAESTLSPEEISNQVETFRKSFEQDAVIKLSWRDKLRRALIHKMSDDSTGTALYLLNPKFHADHVAIQTAVQRGEMATEAQQVEFKTAQQNIRNKIKYLSGEHPESIASRLKTYPLEYKRALLRLRATREKIKEYGPATPKNFEEKIPMKTSEIKDGVLVEVENVYTRDDLERNERIYQNKVKQIEKDRDALLKEQAQVSMELNKIEELIRIGARATEIVDTKDSVMKQSLDLAKEIRTGLATRIVIKSGSDTKNDVTFHLGKATSEAAHRLRTERADIAVSSFLNRRLRFVRIQKNVEKRVEDMKLAYDRIVAINPLVADQLQLKVRIEAAKMANGFGMQATRLGLTGASSGTFILGIYKTVIAAFLGDAKEPLSPEEESIEKLNEQLAQEEARCKSLAQNKIEFDKCIQSYVKILRSHPNYAEAMSGINTTSSSSKFQDFINERDSFIAKMLQYAENENRFAATTNTALKKAYADFDKTQEELNKSIKEFMESLKETPEKDSKN